MYLSGLLLVIFLLNVIAGAWWASPFLGDVGEMLLLLATATIFTITLIRIENKKQE